MGFIKFKFEEDDPEEPFLGRNDEEDKFANLKIDRTFAKSESEIEDFVMDWEKRLGFSQNPFKNEILSPIEKFITGCKKEREKLNLFVIEKKHFGTICGPKGYGKSTILCWLAEQLKKYSKKVIVISLKGENLLEGKGFLTILIDPFISIYERSINKAYLSMTTDEIVAMIKKKLGGKKFVLLIDDFNSVSKQNFDFLNSLISSLPIGIICAGTSEKINKFRSKCESEEKEISDNFRDRLNIKLKGLDFGDMKDLIMKRGEFFGGIGIEPFNDTYLHEIYKKCDKSPSRMLNLCNEHAIELSVNPEKIRSLKEENTERKAMIYASKEFEHSEEVKQTQQYDTIEIIKN
ncbi:MAG: ATP-binding protein [Nanoarchaeota archaeon]|nr:ATP-binding protein [Nanoarchaeota archaeon]